MLRGFQSGVTTSDRITPFGVRGVKSKLDLRNRRSTALDSARRSREQFHIAKAAGSYGCPKGEIGNGLTARTVHALFHRSSRDKYSRFCFQEAETPFTPRWGLQLGARVRGAIPPPPAPVSSDRP